MVSEKFLVVYTPLELTIGTQNKVQGHTASIWHNWDLNSLFLMSEKLAISWVLKVCHSMRETENKQTKKLECEAEVLKKEKYLVRDKEKER